MSYPSQLRQAFLAVAIFTCALPASQAMDWPSGGTVEGSGKIQTQSHALSSFNGILLDLPAKLELRIGSTESITIEADDNLLPLIETVVEKGVLKLRPIKRNQNLRAHTLKIVLNAKAVDRITISGSGSVESDRLRSDKLRLSMSGSGAIDVKGIDGAEATVTVSGNGKFQSGPGTVGRMSIGISGQGDVDAGRIKAQDVDIGVSGRGKTTVWAVNTLDVRVSGSGDVNYYGDPQINRKVSGKADINRLGLAP